MKRTVTSTISVILAVVFVFCLISCDTVEKTGAWENATYRKDMEFGKGSKTIKVEVKAEEQTVTFTINTDKDTVGEALAEHDLIDGEEGPFGLYVKKVNGIVADYDEDRHYWAFYIDGEESMTGVDGTEIDENVTYRLERAK